MHELGLAGPGVAGDEQEGFAGPEPLAKSRERLTMGFGRDVVTPGLEGSEKLFGIFGVHGEPVPSGCLTDLRCEDPHPLSTGDTPNFCWCFRGRY